MARRKVIEKCLGCVKCNSTAKLSFYVGEDKIWGCMVCEQLNLTNCFKDTYDTDEIDFWTSELRAHDFFNIEEYSNGIDLKKVKRIVRKETV